MESKQVKVFSYGETTVRVFLDPNGQAWFILDDVLRALNICEFDRLGAMLSGLAPDICGCMLVGPTGEAMSTSAVSELGAVALTFSPCGHHRCNGADGVWAKGVDFRAWLRDVAFPAARAWAAKVLFHNALNNAIGKLN
jgi:prophage antirepressor-like protein